MFTGKSRKAIKVVFFNLCLLAILSGLWWFLPDSIRTLTWNSPFDAGENWFLALTGTFDNFWFPFFPVVLAGIQYHMPAWLQAGACKYVFLLPVILSFSAGSLVHSYTAGIFSAGLAAVLTGLLSRHGLVIYEQYLEQTLISAAMLMLVNGIALRSLPAIHRSLLLGLLLAIALYAKGVILLFIPVLLLYEAWRESDRVPLRKQWPAMAVLLAVVSAWCFVNLLCGNGFVVIENWSRMLNVGIGATGLVSTAEGNWRVLAGVGKATNMLPWAALEILSHPLRYIFSAFQRLYFLLFAAPLVPGLWALFLLLLAAVFRFRSSPAARPLLLLTGYLLLIHLLMPVEGRYLMPAWFLACCLAGTFLADISVAAAPGDRQRETTAKTLFFAASLPLALCWAFSLTLLITYPVRSKLPRDLQKLEAAHPGSPWIHKVSARQAMEAGNLENAAASFHKAYELEPVRWRKTDYLQTAFTEGSISGAGIREYFKTYEDTDTLLLAALRYAEEGKLAEAGRLLPCALQVCVRNQGSLRYISGGGDVELLKKLRKYGAGKCLKTLSDMLLLVDTERRGALERKLARLDPGLWRPELLYSAFEAGNREAGVRGTSGGAGEDPTAAPPINACQGVISPPGANAPDHTPEALLRSCEALSGKDNKELALQACQRALYAPQSGPGSAALQKLRREALSRSYALLLQLGRPEEAREMLFWSLGNKPAAGR